MPTKIFKRNRSDSASTKAKGCSQFFGNFFGWPQKNSHVFTEKGLKANEEISDVTREKKLINEISAPELTFTTDYIAPYSKPGILDDVKLINKLFLRAEKNAIEVKYVQAIDKNGEIKKYGDRNKTFNNLKETLPYLYVLLLDHLLQFDNCDETGVDLLLALKKESTDIYNPKKQAIIFHSDTPALVFEELHTLRSNRLISKDEHYLVADKGGEQNEIKSLVNASAYHIKKLAQIQFFKYYAEGDYSLSCVLKTYKEQSEAHEGNSITANLNTENSFNLFPSSDSDCLLEFESVNPGCII